MGEMELYQKILVGFLFSFALLPSVLTGVGLFPLYRYGCSKLGLTSKHGKNLLLPRLIACGVFVIISLILLITICFININEAPLSLMIGLSLVVVSSLTTFFLCGSFLKKKKLIVFNLPRALVTIVLALIVGGSDVLIMHYAGFFVDHAEIPGDYVIL